METVSATGLPVRQAWLLLVNASENARSSAYTLLGTII